MYKDDLSQQNSTEYKSNSKLTAKEYLAFLATVLCSIQALSVSPDGSANSPKENQAPKLTLGA